MIKRNPVTVAVLTILTFGVYAYYWLYRTTEELREETGRDDLNPLSTGSRRAHSCTDAGARVSDRGAAGMVSGRGGGNGRL